MQKTFKNYFFLLGLATLPFFSHANLSETNDLKYSTEMEVTNFNTPRGSTDLYRFYDKKLGIVCYSIEGFGDGGLNCLHLSPDQLKAIKE